MGQAPELFSEITLDLVVRTAFELQKLRGREGFEEAEAQGRTDLYFYDLGTEAIRLLFGWEQLLTIEKKAGWARRKSGWMATRRQGEIRQQEQEDERFRTYLSQRVQKLESLAQKLETPRVPFSKAAKELLPRARTKSEDAVPYLKLHLKTVAQMLPPEHSLVSIIQECLQKETIPKGLFSDLKRLFERLHKELVSEKRKASGTKGGRHRILERSSQRARRQKAA